MTTSHQAAKPTPLTHGEELARWRTDEGLQTSELGVKVATIVGAVWQGLHHFPTKDCQRYHRLTLWAEERHIRIVLDKGRSLATWDGSHLTALVILAHEFCVRLDIEAATIGALALNFHPRDGRAGSTMRRHPDIAEAVARWTVPPPVVTRPLISVSDRLGVDCRLGAMEPDSPDEHVTVAGYGHGV